MRPVTTHKMETVKLKELSFYYPYEAKNVLRELGVPEEIAGLFVHREYWTLLRAMMTMPESSVLTGIEFENKDDKECFHDAYEIVHHGTIAKFDCETGEVLVQGITGLLRTVHLQWLLDTYKVTAESVEAVESLVPVVCMTDDVALSTLRNHCPTVHSASFSATRCVVRLKVADKEDDTNNGKETDNGNETGNQDQA